MKQKNTAAQKAAKALGRRSAEVRRKKWGEDAFLAKMRKWGKKGGRPKGSTRKQQKKRGTK